MALARSIRLCCLVVQNSGRRINICSNLKVKLLSTSAQALDLQFVPRSKEASKEDIQRLADFVAGTKRLFVITGAGISTESGIPDYRSEGVGLYSKNSRPIQYMEFLKSADMRQRYWARNYVGWPRFSSFEPNQSHHILSRWEQAGKIHWLVTQNVDTLHHKAGSRRLTELHGSTHRVMCLSCDHRQSRHDLQEVIRAHNPDWRAHSSQIKPDGDISLTPEQVQGFKIDAVSATIREEFDRDINPTPEQIQGSGVPEVWRHLEAGDCFLWRQVPECPKCGDILKPEIVFFGDNVPRPTVDLVYDKLAECDAILVVGSSLEVYSAFRVASRASESHIPMTILNIGKTRADKLAHLKINARCGPVLQQVHDILTASES